MNSLRIIDACTEEHFAAMSRIHARGWHAAYPGHVPDDYLRDVITEDHWIPFFREDYATGRCRGLLLYDGENPVCCCTCGPVRLGPSPRQSEGLVIHGEAYRGPGGDHLLLHRPRLHRPRLRLGADGGGAAPSPG